MIFYYLAVILVVGLLGPFLLLNAKARFGIWQKLGFVPCSLEKLNSHPVWFHAVSVGEFNAVLPLIQRFCQAHPDKKIVISTTTGTGQALAREKAGHFAEIFYFPLDLPWAVNAYLEAIKPSLVVIVETERWPGFTDQCRKRAIPLVAVNARISPGSTIWYQRLGFLFSRMLKQFTMILAQTEVEVERFKAIGGQALPVVAIGNLKFDGAEAVLDEERNALRESLRISPSDFVIVCGSTHENEEAAAIKAWQALRSQGKDNIKLIIAPRHPQRFDRVQEIIEFYGFTAKRFSRGEAFTSEKDIYLLDTIGKLYRHYGICQLAFVGGTLVADVGGHNLLEPYAFAVPVVAGRHYYKTREVARELIARKAILIAKTDVELGEHFASLLNSAQLREKLGQAGNRYLHECQGAVERALQAIDSILDPDTSKTIEAAP